MNLGAVGIFDSGVGGITVFSEIAKELPNEDIIYLGDTKNFPYGDKSKETIIKIATKCVDFLISKNVKLIIIACGTATSQSLDELKNKFDIPIIGIINPTIEDLKKNISKKETIGIIATEGTIKSNKWQIQIKKAIQDATIINKACPLLAPMAEQGWTNNNVAKETIKEYLKPFKGKNINKLILGCTHYPLFKELIQQELGKDVEIIDTGEKMAKYLKQYLLNNNINNEENNKAKYQYYLTDTQCNFKNVATNILQDESIKNKIQKINIE